MKNQVFTRTRYISRISEKRDANVKTRNATPVVKAVSIRTEIGTNHQVRWSGKRVIKRISSNGTIESTRFTRATPIEETTKTDRGMKIRFAISLASCVCEAA